MGWFLIPRKRKKKVEDAESSSVEKVAKKTKRRRKARVKGFDIKKLADQVFADLRIYLGLDTLNVPEDLSRKIVFEILDMLYSNISTKPKLDSIIKKIRRYRDKVNMVIAAKMLEELRDFTDEQLEFIVQNGGRLIVSEISNLYRLLKKRGRIDLIEYLKYVWEKYGFPTPISCPKCGFRAITPDYSCQVCGYVVTENYIRRELGFDDKFKMYIKEASVAELKLVVDLGYVLVGEDGVKNPKLKHKLFFEKKIYYPVYLKAHELVLIQEEISQRKIEV